MNRPGVGVLAIVMCKKTIFINLICKNILKTHITQINKKCFF